MWKYTGVKRPPFAEPTAEGQESVWDYPRPPAVEICHRLVEVVTASGTVIARSNELFRVCETASPPGYYIPSRDVDLEKLVKTDATSYCEWKGMAQYWTLVSAIQWHPVAWSYENPTPNYRMLTGCISFYPGRITCFVDSERVRPQPGQFYGGWITREIVGPLKGAPGTGHW